jgi:hypothetical protein
MPTDPHARYEQRLAILLKDAASRLDRPAQDAAIDEAVNIRFSADRPREIVTDVPGNGTNDVDVPEGWEDGFSTAESIEFPIGNVPESLVDASDWKMYRSPSGLFIRMLASVPQESDSLRVTWTMRHTPDTVPDGDFEALCAYAAALCFETMAASYIQTVDGAIAGDTVNYRTKAQECLSVAKGFRKRYFDHVGIAEDAAGTSVPQAPAMSIGNLHEELQPGLDRILHNKYSR